MSNSFYLAKNTNTRDYNLGSDMYPEYALFDETKTYGPGEIVLWKGFLYIVKSGQTSTPNAKGVFTHNPAVDTSVWEPYETEFNCGYGYINTSVTTIGTADTILVFDALGYNNGIIDSINANGEILIDTDKLCHVSVSVTYETASGYSRTGVRSWVESYDGSAWTMVPGTIMYTYHRQSGEGENTASTSFIVNCANIEAFRVVAVRYSGNGTIQTVTNSNILEIVELIGSRGSQGPPGPAGADGDITWEGPWNSTRNYVTNEAVEYQGSSYVCIQNTNAYQAPTDTNYWDLMAQRGADGAGSSIAVRDDGSLIPNTPHTDLNFVGRLQASDQGAGIARIQLVERPRIIYGASGNQTLTSNSTWTVLALDTDILTNSNYITRSGNRLYAQADNLNLLTAYSIFLYLDSGDSSRNTMVSAIRLNGNTIVDYTQAGCYTRGWNYSKHANCAIPYTLLQLNNGDYIELVFRASEDYQSPHIGNSQSWITMEVL